MRHTILLVALAAVLGSASHATAEGAARTVIEWTFDQPGDLQGWVPNNHLQDIRVEEGELRGEAVDWDPFLTSPLFDVPATPWQWVEIRLKCSRAGRGEVFWSNTLETPHGGFSPGKETGFEVPGDGAWHTIRVTPFWHTEKKIIHLRLDLFQGARFAIDWIRICEPAGAADVSRADAWDFRQGAHGWMPVEGVSAPTASPRGIAVQVTAAAGLLRSPLLNVPIGNRAWVAVRLRARKGSRASLVWATDTSPGLHDLPFPLRDDGHFHTYNLETGGASAWTGTLVALGIRPSHTVGDQVEIESIRLVEEPVGGPDLALVSLGLEDAINRVGKPCRLVAKFVNHGAKPAVGVTAKLTVPKGVTVRPAGGKAPVFEFQLPEAFRYVLTANRPVQGNVTIRLSGPGAPARTFTAPIRITQGPKLPKASYVPPPKPARTDYLIGTYYFPGWDTAGKWECIERVAPIRKPILGYYDEANPECADWQIKWAVEHGINFFLVDWYWQAGERSLEHWLHNAYMKSRYRKHLKWAVMWANHNAPNTHSEEDWRNVTRYWIDHYFKMEEYLRIDGKPAVFIWAPGNIRHDLGGSEGAARLLALSQEMARDAGLPGITFAAMNAGGSPEEARTLAREGYVANATYHWWADAQQRTDDWRNFPFSLVVDRSRPGWEEREKIVEGAGMTFIPTADTGWDSRPWHGDTAMTIPGRTVPQWERLLREAKAYLDARGEKMLILGPCNEWGEGSYIEPCAEFGFGMYDAIRRVFCDEPEAHTDVAPVDVGLGPYDFPLARTSTRGVWEFNTPGDAEGWGALMGLSTVTVRDGALHAETRSADPAFSSSTVHLQASQFAYAAIRLKAGPASGREETLQLFWSTASQGASEAASVKVPLVADGRWRTYVLPVGENPRWRGIIRGLRLDPGGTPGIPVWIDFIRFSKEKPAE